MPYRMTPVTAFSRLRKSAWSTMVSIPGSPARRAFTTSNWLVSLSFTRNEAGRASGDVFWTSSCCSAKISWNRSQACCLDS